MSPQPLPGCAAVSWQAFLELIEAAVLGGDGIQLTIPVDGLTVQPGRAPASEPGASR